MDFTNVVSGDIQLAGLLDAVLMGYRTASQILGPGSVIRRKTARELLEKLEWS